MAELDLVALASPGDLTVEITADGYVIQARRINSSTRAC